MTKAKDFTNMGVSIRTKKELNKLKLHPRESYNDVIERLIKESPVSKVICYEKGGKK